MHTLEEDLTCSVCYSLFSDPRVLPCSHTFCKTCLDNLLQVSNNYSIWRPLRLPIKCPVCRSVVELPPTGVDALPTNVSLRAIIEKVGALTCSCLCSFVLSFYFILFFFACVALSTRWTVSRDPRHARSTAGILSTCTASRIGNSSAGCV